MSEYTDTPPGADFSGQNPLRETLASITPALNDAIRNAGIVTNGDAVALREGKVEIRNDQSTFETGFVFWGVLRPDFGDFREPTAIINDMRVPNPGNGVGSLVLEAWEAELVKAGVRNFAAGSIKARNPDGSINLKAVKFWEKHGYKPWGSVGSDGIPYAMVKTFEDQVVT